MLLDAVMSGRSHTLIDLTEHEVSPYDYEHRNASDVFAGFAEQMRDSDSVVLATPVYWYAMCAQLKTFIDRLSDLITIRKPLGQALAGRMLYAVVSSTDENLPAGFMVPFQSTAEYLDMHWGGIFHDYFARDLQLAAEVAQAAREFGDVIFASNEHE